MTSQSSILIDVQRAAIRFPVELASILEISVEELKNVISISANPKLNAKQKLCRARHLNEKLSESALGIDNTLHQLIEEELSALEKILDLSNL